MNVFRRIALATLAAAVALPLAAAEPAKQSCEAAQKAAAPKVRLKTSAGVIVLELNRTKAPISTENFINYVASGHYNGTIFHRVIDGFMIQGGGFSKDMQERGTKAPIKNEAANGLKNDKYTLAMARTNVVDSATAQFFINVKDNDFLNHRGENSFGYAVFGTVVDGKQVVDKIAKVPTSNAGMFQNVPVVPVVIESAECL